MTKREEIEKKIRDILDKWTNYEVSLAVRYFIDDRIRLEGGEHKRVNGHDQAVKELSKLLTKSNEEAVKEFRKELVKLYPAFPNKQTLADIEFWKVLMDKAEETLTQQSLDKGDK